MDRIGQTQAILIPTRSEVWGTFRAVQKTNLAKQSAPCVTDPDYSYTQCMMDYVISTAGCRLDWVHSSRGHDYEPCTTWDQVLQNTHYYYFHTMVEGDQELFSTLMRIFYTECGHKDFEMK